MATETPVERVPRRWAALDGLLATGAGLGAGHLAGLVAPGSSPVVAVATRAIDLTPGPVKDWAVSTFGTNDKAVLVIGAIVVTLGLGALVGLVARRSTGSALVGVAALIALALVAAGADRARPLLWWVPGLVALLVGGWALLALVNASRRAMAPAVLEDPSRRRWLGLALAAGGVGVLGGLLGQGLKASGEQAPVTLPTRSMTPFPEGLEVQTPGINPFVTATKDFYRIDVALEPPSLDTKTWRLSIEGMIDRPFSIGWDDLLAMDAIERPVTLECVSNEVGGDLIGSARWFGVRTKDLLARAGVQAGADMVLSSSADGFSVSTPLQALLDDRDALVVYEMNGAPLPPKHGFPVRLLTPGLYGFVGATKWLTKMEVTTYAKKQAYWTVLGWSDHGPIKPGSQIDVPKPGSHVPAGSVRVGGTAWAHGVGVGKVQVRVDGGPWTDAILGPDGGVEYWRQWLWTWDGTRGDHQLQVRVVDTNGRPQDDVVVDPFPNGASGLHTVKVTLT
ncbi:MAG TPA: molybdopterin-dependent oxidoreductase [Propionibacteriaceae bacterium]|nr:molybdopterin-dependent oxidoreductase [Propionibacteriaceae bacterium]